MRMHPLMILAVGLIFAPDAPLEGAGKERAGKQSVEDFQGFWTAASATLDGKPLPEGEAGKIHMIVSSGGIYETRGMEGDDGEFKIDPEKDPKCIDMTPARGPDRGKTCRGIYELDGNELRVCTAPPGGQRPDEFRSEPGSGRKLITWRDPSREDRQKLRGTWTVVSAGAGGKPAKGSGIENLVFAGIESTMVTGGRPWKTRYELGMTGKLKTLDFWTIDLPMKAIYKFEGDDLHVCLGDTQGRPTDFDSKSGLHLILKRDKPAADREDR